MIVGFNSRSRVGSDARRHHARTPTRSFNSRSRVGSDPALGDVTALKTVSIRAPAWGATHMTRQHALQRTVSIRAPAWGATHLARLFRDDAVFQFALPRGERRMNHIVDCLLTVFQFALPRGERHPAAIRCIDCQGFNSRSRVGSDTKARPAPAPTPAFQFALPRGERHAL